MSSCLCRLQEYHSCRQGRLSFALVVSPTSTPLFTLLTVLLHRNVIISYFVWLMATRTAKLLPHLWHRPQDIIHVPAFILFGYYFAVMKLYALFTLHEVCLLRSHFMHPNTILIICFLTLAPDRVGNPCRYRRPDRRNSSHGQGSY